VPFRWRYLADDGSTAGESDLFSQRADAEAWLADSWESLAGDGVIDVMLIEGDHELFRMSLEEPS